MLTMPGANPVLEPIAEAPQTLPTEAIQQLLKIGAVFVVLLNLLQYNSTLQLQQLKAVLRMRRCILLAGPALLRNSNPTPAPTLKSTVG
jgi:hypothetical protein